MAALQALCIPALTSSPLTQDEEEPQSSRPQHSRPSRVTGYHNPLDNAPPDLDAVLPTYGLPPSGSQLCQDVLPPYACSVKAEGRLRMKIESLSPFDEIEEAEWKDVFVVLQGTLLSVHQLKSKSTKSQAAEYAAGRLLKKYTLQHAEAGLAHDHARAELVPRSSLTSMLPEAVVQRLQRSDPHLFESVNLYVLRLRLETDQILFRFEKKSDRITWLNKVCMAIDISHPLETRSEPRYHTLPRRRRCDFRGQLEAMQSALRSLVDERGQLVTAGSPDVSSALPDPGREDISLDDQRNSQDPDAADLDASVAFEDLATQATLLNRTADILGTLERYIDDRSPSSMNGESLFLPNVNNADTTTSNPDTQQTCKSSQRSAINTSQQARHQRRCLPALLANSRRATDIVISDGRRMQIDWQIKSLVSHSLAPPPYDELETSPIVEGNGLTVIRQLLTRTSSSASISRTSSTGSTNHSSLRRSISTSKQKDARPAPSSSSQSLWRTVATWSKGLKRSNSKQNAVDANQCATTDTNRGQLKALKSDRNSSRPVTRGLNQTTVCMLGI